MTSNGHYIATGMAMRPLRWDSAFVSRLSRLLRFAVPRSERRAHLRSAHFTCEIAVKVTACGLGAVFGLKYLFDEEEGA